MFMLEFLELRQKKSISGRIEERGGGTENISIWNGSEAEMLIG